MPEGRRPLKVVVAGGSIGGLCAGLALRGIGCEVDVFERTPGAMASRGAGIVVQDDLRDLLHRHGAPDLPTTSCSQRRYLLADGGNGEIVPALPQRFTSWDAIFRTLRSVFPSEHYHPGMTLSTFEQMGRRVRARFGEDIEIEADLLVCADGSRSEARLRLLPGVQPLYAGYVAWRGTIAENRLEPRLVGFFDQSFTICEARSGGHILCYPIPGPDSATLPGQRRLNWVWYVGVPTGPGLDRLLTDRNGKRQAGSVTAGMVPEELTQEVHAAAARDLHPRLGDLVRLTPDPFVQVIVDVAVPRMVFERVCLIGDAAFVLRPHAAAATAKVAGDAACLADALASAPGRPDIALRAWEARRLEQGRNLLEHGVALGRRSVERRDAIGPCRTEREMAERFGPIALPPRRD